MFAALTLDREPPTLSWPTFLSSLNEWTQVVGGFAMGGLVLWLIFSLVSRGNPAAGNALVRMLAGSLLGVLAMVLLGPFGALIVFVYLLRRKAIGADSM